MARNPSLTATTSKATAAVPPPAEPRVASGGPGGGAALKAKLRRVREAERIELARAAVERRPGGGGDVDDGNAAAAALGSADGTLTTSPPPDAATLAFYGLLDNEGDHDFDVDLVDGIRFVSETQTPEKIAAFVTKDEQRPPSDRVSGKKRSKRRSKKKSKKVNKGGSKKRSKKGTANSKQRKRRRSARSDSAETAMVPGLAVAGTSVVVFNDSGGVGYQGFVLADHAADRGSTSAHRRKAKRQKVARTRRARSSSSASSSTTTRDRMVADETSLVVLIDLNRQRARIIDAANATGSPPSASNRRTSKRSKGGARKATSTSTRTGETSSSSSDSSPRSRSRKDHGRSKPTGTTRGKTKAAKAKAKAAKARTKARTKAAKAKVKAAAKAKKKREKENRAVEREKRRKQKRQKKKEKAAAVAQKLAEAEAARRLAEKKAAAAQRKAEADRLRAVAEAKAAAAEAARIARILATSKVRDPNLPSSFDAFNSSGHHQRLLWSYGQGIAAKKTRSTEPSTKGWRFASAHVAAAHFAHAQQISAAVASGNYWITVFGQDPTFDARAKMKELAPVQLGLVAEVRRAVDAARHHHRDDKDVATAVAQRSDLGGPAIGGGPPIAAVATGGVVQ